MSSKDRKNIHLEFFYALFEPYTFDPIHNIAARWGITWAVLLIFLQLYNLFKTHAFMSTTVLILCMLYIILYPTIGAMGTILDNKM